MAASRLRTNHENSSGGAFMLCVNERKLRIIYFFLPAEQKSLRDDFFWHFLGEIQHWFTDSVQIHGGVVCWILLWATSRLLHAPRQCFWFVLSLCVYGSLPPSVCAGPGQTSWLVSSHFSWMPEEFLTGQTFHYSWKTETNAPSSDSPQINTLPEAFV